MVVVVVLCCMRRYREFDALDNSLRSRFPEQPLPTLPPKSSLFSTLVGGRGAEQLRPAVEARQRALATYVQALCSLPATRESGMN